MLVMKVMEKVMIMVITLWMIVVLWPQLIKWNLQWITLSVPMGNILMLWVSVSWRYILKLASYYGLAIVARSLDSFGFIKALSNNHNEADCMLDMGFEP